MFLWLPSFHKRAAFIGKTPNKDHDEVNQIADSEKAAGQQPNNAGSHLARIKPVDAQISKKEAKQAG